MDIAEVKYGQILARKRSPSHSEMLVVVDDESRNRHRENYVDVAIIFDGGRHSAASSRASLRTVLERNDLAFFVPVMNVFDVFPVDQPRIHAVDSDTALLDFLETNLDAISLSLTPSNSTDNFGATLTRTTANPRIDLRNLAKNFLAIRNRYTQ